MNLKGNTILITGGATGIGFSFADKLVKLGNTVLICGRRKEKLEEAKRKSPSLLTFRADISNEMNRIEIFNYVRSELPALNILINNAGIQRKIDLTAGEKGFMEADNELEINLKSQLHMIALFLPLLIKQPSSAIVNVTSGLGIVPLSRFPIYSATKAAMHSYSLSLRHQLTPTGVKVFEVIPPTVYDTDLKGGPIEKSDYSISTNEMTDAFIDGFQKDILEIAAGPAKKWLDASAAETRQIFSGMNH
ncbi:MAG: SDR family NAD(P)-dependent oxidoreductase [Thermoplasmatales archaeon]